MKRLGDLILPRALEWSDRLSAQMVSQSLRVTLAGQAVIAAKPLAWRPVTLTARDGVAWFNTQQVNDVLAMANVAGGAWLLDWEGEVLMVAFRNHEPPAASFTPLWPNAPRYTGEIKLIAL